jgi:hypothetical protein
VAEHAGQFWTNGKEERNMVAAKREATAARPKREYPTEWAMYPGEDEELEQQELQIGGPYNQANPETGEPHRLSEKLKRRENGIVGGES